MSCCSVCSKQKKKLFHESEDCVEAALDKIKRHYLYLKNALEEKEQRLQSLEERNEKLQRVVDMLQREKSPPSAGNGVSPKRRKKATTRSLDSTSESPAATYVDLSLSASDDEAPELNMALNSEQLFDCTVWSPTRNESIAETEKVRSPRVLRTPGRWGTRQELKDNTKPFVKIGAASGRTMKSEWISKESKAGPSAPCTSTFLRPQAARSDEKKASLSLKKKDKLRQTRLQLTPIRKKSFFVNDTTSCEEAIGASPNLDEPLKHSKTKRSCFQRTDNSVTNESPFKESAVNPKIELNDDDDDVFDLCTNAKRKMDNNKDTTTNMDELLPLSAEESQSNSSSVLFMTPATQEIIFLDDTYDSHIESMDLMRDLMKVGGDASLNNLKRIESKGIKKLQLKKPKVVKEVDERQQPMTSKQSNQVQKAKATVNVKLENITQDPKNLMEKENYSEELEEEFPLPMLLVKEERLSGVPANKLSVMERFKVDCRDCQNYIKFRGDSLSDKELEEHLRNCTRHKERDAFIPQTPDDFWNPLIVPFNSDDPRNEVLIDSRFVGKKRSKQNSHN